MKASLVPAVVVVVSDQVSKWYMRGNGQAILNQTGVLGWGSNLAWVGLGFLVLGWMWWKGRVEAGKWFQMGLWVIMAAGVSNLMDRLWWGGVWDFIHYPQLGVIGNVADIWLGVGVIIVISSKFKVQSSKIKVQRSKFKDQRTESNNQQSMNSE